MKSTAYLLQVDRLFFISRLILIHFVFFCGLGNVFFSRLQAMNQGHTILKIDIFYQFLQLIRSRRLATIRVITIALWSIGIMRK